MYRMLWVTKTSKIVLQVTKPIDEYWLDFCQVHAKLDISGKKESQMRKSLHQDCLWACLWRYFFA